MKFVITLGDAVELACFALALAGLAIGVAVNWARERRPVRPHEAANRPPRGQVADHLRADGTTVGKLGKSAVPEKERQIHDLYFAAVEFRRAQLEFCDGANVRTMKELLDSGAILQRILVETNNGKDPVRFVSRADNICDMAALIAGG